MYTEYMTRQTVLSLYGGDNKININSIPSGAVKVYYGPDYHAKAFSGIPVE